MNGRVPDAIGPAGPGFLDGWLHEQRRRARMRVTRIPLRDVRDWTVDDRTGDIAHRTGRFFVVHGLDVHVPGARVERWQQPIIDQPEIGVLGFLAKEFGGVKHFLVQAKAEPGNCNGVQLSPTVQATRSNYLRVHEGRPVPYLHYFQRPQMHRVLADVRQSEQGSWFLRKRNRNMVVEVTDDVELLDGFCWLTLPTLDRLLAVDDLVNMDARTVLACLPFGGPTTPGRGDAFATALARSSDPAAGSVHDTLALLSWITESRTRTELHVRRIPLREVSDWSLDGGVISHASGRYFDVIGVDVRAAGREVATWAQPMLAVHQVGLAAFVARTIDGVLHLLVHARVEPGYTDTVELAPTVQFTPANHAHLGAPERPRFSRTVLDAPAHRIHVDTTLSEEGGRFFHARTRYMVVEDHGTDDLELDGFRWMTMHQLDELLRHSYYVNIQARSLVACIRAHLGRSPAGRAARGVLSAAAVSS